MSEVTVSSFPWTSSDSRDSLASAPFVESVRGQPERAGSATVPTHKPLTRLLFDMVHSRKQRASKCWPPSKGHRRLSVTYERTPVILSWARILSVATELGTFAVISEALLLAAHRARDR